MEFSIDEEMERYKEIFHYFDHDKKGYIVADDFAVVLRLMNQNPTDREVQDLQRLYDINGDGKITLEEMVTIVKNRMETKDDESEIRQAFRVFDKNGDGYLSRQELSVVLTTVGERLQASDVDEILNCFDENSDGVLQYEEFAKMLLHSNSVNQKEDRSKQQRKHSKNKTNV